jgi:hypothetical protein
MIIRVFLNVLFQDLFSTKFGLIKINILEWNSPGVAVIEEKTAVLAYDLAFITRLICTNVLHG